MYYCQTSLVWGLQAGGTHLNNRNMFVKKVYKIKDKIQQRCWKTFFVIWRAKQLNQIVNDETENKPSPATTCSSSSSSFSLSSSNVLSRSGSKLCSCGHDSYSPYPVLSKMSARLSFAFRPIPVDQSHADVVHRWWRNASNQLLIHVIPVVWDCPVVFWPLRRRLWLTNVQSVSSVSMSALA